MSQCKRLNKCCFDNKNTIIISAGWSFLCGVCGRYTYDWDSNQYTAKRSKLLLGKERYIQLLSLARKKIKDLSLAKFMK